MKYFFHCLIALVLVTTSVSALDHDSFVFDNKPIANIKITVENLQPGESFSQSRLSHSLQSKVGDPFSQITFDRDLKGLSEDYGRVEPDVEVEQGKVYITIKLWKKPIIRNITWIGNKHIKSRRLQKELGIQPHTIFNKDTFNQGFSKVKELYVKKGYFESELEYKVIPYENTNEVDIEVHVHEGHSGHIKKIVFHGLTPKEQSGILALINTKKYNFFTSWLTGYGTYHEEALEHDKLLIVDYLQNQGYANATVDVRASENEEGQLIISISAQKGALFHVGRVTVHDNTLIKAEKIRESFGLKQGDVFSPEELRNAIERVEHLFGKDGYIEAHVDYTLFLQPGAPTYNIELSVEEGEKYKIGLINVLGNTSTNKNVILRESLLVPGEVFDSRRLKATERRLEAMGYFKSVNVYTVKTREDDKLGENYRDVVIEVEETMTGSASMFFGFSNIDEVFGGIDIAENNFNHEGLWSWWREGMSAFRGAGEFASLKAQIGMRQQSYTLAWMNPYLNDTLWRFGFDTNYSISRIQSKDYHVSSIGGSIFANYPLTQFVTFGSKYRISNSIVTIFNVKNEEAQRERQNSGIVTAIGPSLGYDSTDNAFKPHRGIRTFSNAELGLVRRHGDEARVFPFVKCAFLNTYYHPLWSMGTLKLRGDVKFLYPFGAGEGDLVPLNERFFLGGETTVRGFRPFSIGPKFQRVNDDGVVVQTDDPTGGMSSLLFSVEYLQNIVSMLDLFVFFDGGSIAAQTFTIDNVKFSVGVGAMVQLANRMPIIVGYGYPLNLREDEQSDYQGWFVAMGGQF